MAQYYSKQGNNWYVLDDSPSVGRQTMTLVSDPNTIKALKSGQLPFRSESTSRTLSFSDSEQPSPYFQQQNNRSLNLGGIENPASTSLNQPGQNFGDMIKQATIDTLNRLQDSRLSGLQARQSEIQTRMLTAPVPDVSKMTPSAGTNAIQAQGQEFQPALQSITSEIGKERQSQNELLQTLQTLAGLVSKLSPETQKRTDDIINYEYAKSNGYGGTFDSWLTADANRKAKITGNTGLDSSTLQKVQQIAGQFDSEQIVKDYNTVATQVSYIKGLGTAPTDDIARVYAFAKIMDPQSAVRTEEYNTVQEYATALYQALGLKVARVFDNRGFLTQEARNLMNKTLQDRLNTQTKTYNNVSSEYARRINKITGLTDGNEYITDYSKGYESPVTVNMIRVRRKSDGITGSLPENEFDTNLYEKIQ
jgi:hypothetical protein